MGRRRRAREARAHRGRDVRGARARGDVKMVWIACTNPAQSLPDLPKRARGARRAPSSSCCRRPTPTPRPRPSPTCCCPRRAGARRTAPSPTPSGASRACAPPCRAPGEARHDWEIAVDFARRLEARLRLRTRAHADAVSRTHRRSEIFGRAPRADARPRPRHHRPLLRDARARRAAAVAVSARARPRAARASTRTALPDARRPRALLRRALRAASPRRVDARYPLRLTTGRLRDQWHGMSRTGTVAQPLRHVARAARWR